MVVVPLVYSNSYTNYQSFTFHSSQSALPAALRAKASGLRPQRCNVQHSTSHEFERLGLGTFVTVNDDRRSITPACIGRALRPLLLLLLVTLLTVTPHSALRLRRAYESLQCTAS